MDIVLNLWSEGEYDFAKILRIIKLLIEQIRRTATAVHLLEKIAGSIQYCGSGFTGQLLYDDCLLFF